LAQGESRNISGILGEKDIQAIFVGGAIYCGTCNKDICHTAKEHNLLFQA